MKGFAQLYLIGAVAGLLAIGGAYAWGRMDGNTVANAKWQKRELAIAEESQAKITAAKDNVIASERRKAEELAMVSGFYQTELRKAADEKDRVIAGLRDGTRRLYVSARCPSSPNGLPGPDAPAGGRDGGTAVELPQSLSVALSELMAEADAVAAQLRACQAIVSADRKK